MDCTLAASKPMKVMTLRPNEASLGTWGPSSRGARRCGSRTVRNSDASDDRRQRKVDQHPLPGENVETEERLCGPAIRCGDQSSANHRSKRSAADKAELQQRERARQLLRRKGIGKQRIGRRRVRRSAGGKKYARPDELHERLGDAGQPDEDADHRRTARQHELARIDISQPGQRDADEEIADDRCRSGQESQLRISQVESRA